MIKERKRTYTQEEVNELKKWFDSQELPPTMQIDKAAFTPNLKDTVDMLFEQAYVCYENPKMQGCLYLLEKIKRNLEKNGEFINFLHQQNVKIFKVLTFVHL